MEDVCSEKKKRLGTEESQSEESEEEPLKRRKIPEDDECEHFIFFEDDTDSDLDDDFKGWIGTSELSHEDEYVAPMFPEEDGQRRRCLEADVCNRYQHKAEFKGLSFFELFKIKLKFNDKLRGNEPLEKAQLYGEIVKYVPSHAPVPKPLYDKDNSFPITYYYVRHDKSDYINLDSVNNKYILLPISGPNPRPPLNVRYTLCFDFALKINGEDIFSGGVDHVNPEIFGNDTPVKAGLIYLPRSFDYQNRDHGPPIMREVVGAPDSDRILLCAHYSVYDGSWATINVKILKEGVRSFHGFIVARPCIFYSRICLLSIQPGNKIRMQRDDKGEVEPDGSIKLTRSVVAVPSYSSLIFGAELYDHESDEVICRGRTYFHAKESGEETNFIFYNGVKTLQVSLQWNCFP